MIRSTNRVGVGLSDLEVSKRRYAGSHYISAIAILFQNLMQGWCIWGRELTKSRNHCHERSDRRERSRDVQKDECSRAVKKINNPGAGDKQKHYAVGHDKTMWGSRSPRL